MITHDDVEAFKSTVSPQNEVHGAMYHLVSQDGNMNRLTATS